MVINKCKRVLRLCLVVAFAVVAGCSKFESMPPEDAVRERAQAWLDAMMAGKYDEAWNYTSPNYREFSSPANYSAVVQGAGRWINASVDSVTCVEDVCDVGIMVDYKIKRLGMENKRSLPYKWVLIDKEWWLNVPTK